MIQHDDCTGIRSVVCHDGLPLRLLNAVLGGGGGGLNAKPAFDGVLFFGILNPIGFV